MDHKGLKENEMKRRIFRCEDYNNRRVFLRSYPLQWEEDNGAKEEMSKVHKENSEKKLIKKIILPILHWGEGKVVVLRRFKDKIAVYVIACVPAAFKPHTALISA